MTTSVTTTRPIDLVQLTRELGAPSLSMADYGDERTITAHGGVPTKTLQAAVDAHVPTAAPPTLEEQVIALKARVTAAEEATDSIIIGALMGEFPPF